MNPEQTQIENAIAMLESQRTTRGDGVQPDRLDTLRLPSTFADWPASMRLDCTVLSSIGVVTVSTRRVVIVTLCDQRRSRCRSTFTPCTPRIRWAGCR
jgi:hypothetical protein